MPLTIAHPAAAVPLRKLRLPTSALIMGTVAPDFEFFLRLTDERLIAHTIPGLLIFCLPVGLVGLLIFHTFLKYPLISLLPHSHQARLYPVAIRFSFGPPRTFIRIVAGVLCGALSHVLWDSLTHSHGWFISLFPSMRQPLGVVGGILFKRYDIIAVASAVVGVVILATAYARWYRRAPVLHTFRPHPLPWTARFAIGTGIGGSSALAGLGYAFITTPTETVKPFVASTLVSSVSAFLAIWALYSAVWHILTSPGQRGHSPQHAGAMPDNRAPSPGRKP